MKQCYARKSRETHYDVKIIVKIAECVFYQCAKKEKCYIVSLLMWSMARYLVKDRGTLILLQMSYGRMKSEMLANRFMGKLDCENTRIMVNYKKTGYEFETRRKQVVQCRFKAQKKSGKRYRNVLRDSGCLMTNL